MRKRIAKMYLETEFVNSQDLRKYLEDQTLKYGAIIRNSGSRSNEAVRGVPVPHSASALNRAIGAACEVLSVYPDEEKGCEKEVGGEEGTGKEIREGVGRQGAGGASATRQVSNTYDGGIIFATVRSGDGQGGNRIIDAGKDRKYQGNGPTQPFGRRPEPKNQGQTKMPIATPKSRSISIKGSSRTPMRSTW